MSKTKLVAVLGIIAIMVAGILIYNFTRQTPEEPYEVIGNPVPKGDRILLIDVGEAVGVSYNEAFQLGKDAGMDATSLSIQWDDIETAPGEYYNQYLGIANAYYPLRNTSISLMIGPIDTTNKRVPSDLANKPFDDPAVIERFKGVLEYVFSEIPDLELVSLAIGNEIDIYLGTSATKWRQYINFYNATAAYAKTLRPGLIVGTKITFDGMTGYAKEYAKEINQISDVIMVTYYPLKGDFSVEDPEVVESDFDALASLYEDKPIYVLECGYPSSEKIDSSERKQREFIRHVFMAWDEHNSQILAISFTWQHDVPNAIVDQWAIYYGLSDEGFLEFLRTLGLRTYNGKDKEAWIALKAEAEARGW